jgi:hypothetical protein
MSHPLVEIEGFQARSPGKSSDESAFGSGVFEAVVQEVVVGAEIQ